MQRYSLVALWIAFVVLGIFTNPATAALLNFNFTTSSDATGSFTLDTDTLPAFEPALFAPTATGISFPNAVSDFSLSAQYINLSSVTTDFNVAPYITSDLIDFPANLGVLSGVSYPPGCITEPGFTCLFDIAFFYSDDLSKLPILSDNPLSYTKGVGVDFFDPATRELLIRDDITNLKVVPEPDPFLGILTFGIASTGLLIKRNRRCCTMTF
jgi:hypothetical protein